jgi:hypothetical protein
MNTRHSQNNGSESKEKTKAAPQRKRKVQTNAPLSERYARKEGSSRPANVAAETAQPEK